MGYSPEDERLIDTAFDRLMEHCTKICKTEKDADLIKRAFFWRKRPTRVCGVVQVNPISCIRWPWR